MTESNVRKLREEAKASGEVRVVPSIGMSVVMNMPGDRQATLQAHIAQEDGEDAANGLLDRMFRIADRQRARYELVDFEIEVEKLRRTLANYVEDSARIEKDFALKKVEQEEQAAAYLEEAEAEARSGYDEHVKSGRQTDYVQAGHRKQKIEAKKNAAAQVRLQIEKEEAERRVALDGLRNNKERYRSEIERLEKEIAKRKALLGETDGA